MKRLLILLVIISIFLSGCGNKEEAAAQEEIENTVKEEIIYVKTQTIGTRDFEKTLSLPATLEPKEKVMISTKIGGAIESIFVDIGSRVEKDQSLCKIDDTIYKIQFEKANTAVRSATNTLSNVKDFDKKNGMKHQQIEVAESQYETAKINYDNLEKSYKRIETLFKDKGVSQSDYDSIKGKYDLAKKQLDLAATNLEQAKRNWKYNVESAEIGLEAANNDYKLAKENLEYTDILAPISGIIAEKKVSVGENIGAGADMFTIVNTDSMYANSGVSEKDVVKIKEDQQVFIKVGSLGDKIIEGEVANISPIIDEQSKTYPIKVLVQNINNELKGGMFTTVEIVVDSHKNAIAIPKNAVINEEGKHYAFIESDGKAVKRLVKLGYSEDDYYEVLEGVKKGEKVIKSFNDKLEHGSIVKSN
ncbi:efflux RND transporter periplasmic adaptor subunit [Wukongibacter baidiensis]|uniref:efflux RND transporter periplasmic adaptor subunit n=1 Tax=Wukongibacter baidiensis TaxID=1723361 RepID=UPI003D7FE2B4